MAELKKYIYEVEPPKPELDGKPSVGPVYRSIFAKDGFPQPPPGMNTCWDIFRLYSSPIVGLFNLLNFEF